MMEIRVGVMLTTRPSFLAHEAARQHAVNQAILALDQTKVLALQLQGCRPWTWCRAGTVRGIRACACCLGARALATSLRAGALGTNGERMLAAL